MDEQIAKMFATAYKEYIKELSQSEEPSFKYLSYDFSFLEKESWRGLGYQLVENELRETTNIINNWLNNLMRWNAWNNVIDEYDDLEKAWSIRNEFLEALVHHCLLQPSAIRDTIVFISTNSFHQVRITCEENYKDYLEGDPKGPNEKPIYFSRKKKEGRLMKLISHWGGASRFLTSLRLINCKEYQAQTYDYRNRASHAIAPRLELGVTQFVIRSVIQAEEMKKQEDGKYMPIPIEGKMAVRYSFGGIQPLELRVAYKENLKQYVLTRKCYMEYKGLLEERVKFIKD